MPAPLRDHLASICERHDLKLDDVVCNQIKRWLLAKTIALIEAEAEEERKARAPRQAARPAKGEARRSRFFIVKRGQRGAFPFRIESAAEAPAALISAARPRWARRRLA